jgi:uncharacterized protein YciI
MPDTPQFLCTLRPTRLAMLTDGPTDAEADTIRRHFAYLSGLAEKGILVLAGRTLDDNDQTRGIAIFNAESEDHVRRLVDDDPAVAEGVMTPTIQPFRVAIHSRKAASND